MQNKGLVRLFALVFGFICLYQLSFTYKAYQVENDASEYAIKKIKNGPAHIDVNGNETPLVYDEFGERVSGDFEDYFRTR